MIEFRKIYDRGYVEDEAFRTEIDRQRVLHNEHGACPGTEMADGPIAVAMLKKLTLNSPSRIYRCTLAWRGGVHTLCGKTDAVTLLYERNGAASRETDKAPRLA